MAEANLIEVQSSVRTFGRNRIAMVRLGLLSVRSVPVRSGSGSFWFRINSISDSHFLIGKMMFRKNVCWGQNVLFFQVVS